MIDSESSGREDLAISSSVHLTRGPPVVLYQVQPDSYFSGAVASPLLAYLQCAMPGCAPVTTYTHCYSQGQAGPALIPLPLPLPHSSTQGPYFPLPSFPGVQFVDSSYSD